MEAFRRFAGDGGAGFRRLAYGAIRQSVIDRWNQQRLADGLEPWDPQIVYHPRGVPDNEIDIFINTSSVASRVRAAMLEHRTQWQNMNPEGLTETQKLNNVSRETEVMAWPRPRPNRLLGDIFEDFASID